MGITSGFMAEREQAVDTGSKWMWFITTGKSRTYVSVAHRNWTSASSAAIFWTLSCTCFLYYVARMVLSDDQLLRTLVAAICALLIGTRIVGYMLLRWEWYLIDF